MAANSIISHSSAFQALVRGLMRLLSATRSIRLEQKYGTRGASRRRLCCPLSCFQNRLEREKSPGSFEMGCRCNCSGTNGTRRRNGPVSSGAVRPSLLTPLDLVFAPARQTRRVTVIMNNQIGLCRWPRSPGEVRAAHCLFPIRISADPSV